MPSLKKRPLKDIWIYLQLLLKNIDYIKVIKIEIILKNKYQD